MECPTKHHYSYRERLRKQTYYQSNRIDIGIVVHEALEAALKAYHNVTYETPLEIIYDVIDERIAQYAAKNMPQEKALTPEGFEIDNTQVIADWTVSVEVARKIAKRTIKHLDVPKNWRTETIEWEGETVPLIEFRFEYPLVEDRNIVGKIDWVARNLEDGQVYLIDWKTRKIFTDDYEVAGEDMNLQLSIYQYVLQSMGIPTFATITYQIRSTVPATPEVTKQGRVSRAKIATDYETYTAAILANNEQVEDYAEFLSNLQTTDYWWLPIRIIRGQHELRSRWDTVQKIAMRMVHDDDPPKYETPRCTYCPFFQLCLGSDRGLDIDSIKEMSYTVSTYKH